MADDLKKLTIKQADLSGKEIADMPDHPTVEGMSANEIKAWFDEVPSRFIALSRYNDLIATLTTSSGVPGAAQISAVDSGGAFSDTQTVLNSLFNDVLERVRKVTDSGSSSLRTSVVSDGEKVRLTITDTEDAEYETAFELLPDGATIKCGAQTLVITKDAFYMDNNGERKDIKLDYAVVQYDSTSDFPAVGDENTLYVDLTNKGIYFWITEDARYEAAYSAGLASTIEVVRTETLPPGSLASVVNEGDATNARLAFYIPRGDKGAQGVGDMEKAVYDTDDDGKVDAAAQADSALRADFADSAEYAFHLAGEDALIYLRNDTAYPEIGDERVLDAIKDNSERIESMEYEYGENTNGEYYKYPDGRLVCYKKVQFSVTYTTSGGGLTLVSDNYSLGDWPYAFYGDGSSTDFTLRPNVQASVAAFGGGGFMVQYSGYNFTFAGHARFAAFWAAATNIVVVSLKAEGRWKQ